MKNLKGFFEVAFLIIGFIIVWCTIGFLVGAAFGAGQMLYYPPPTYKIYPTHVDTITMVETDTIIEYRDTSDSQFLKTIIELECSGYSKLAKGKEVYPKVGDGGKAIGIFQMHESYFNCKLAQALDYKYEDMLRPDKSFHIFWAKMGIYADWFYREFGRVPTHEELARMHNGSRKGHNRDSTLRYRNKFRKRYNTRLNGSFYNQLG